VGQRSKLPWLT